MASLMDMPEVAMKIILEKLDYVEIQCLRKTCVSLRHFIDDTRPEQSMNELKIDGSPGIIYLAIHGSFLPLYPSGQRIHIQYEKLERGNTKISWYRRDKTRHKTILNEKFSEVFSRDFELILECKLPILNLFSIDLKDTSEHFLEMHLFNENPIKTNTFTLENGQRQDDILSFLPYICADTLEKLEIEFIALIEAVDISKIIKLDHWKKAKELNIYGSPVTAGIQNFEHFSFLSVKFEVLYLKDVLFLKELFLHTPSTSKQFRINFQELSVEDAFIQEFGRPITTDYYSVRRELLIYKRPDDKENVVTIGFFPEFFEFKIVKKCDVPKDLNVIN